MREILWKMSCDEAEISYTPEQASEVQRLLRIKDHYEILGVSKKFTPTELRRNYKRLIRKFHPDKNKAPDATEATKAVIKAYNVLSDPEKKLKYDLTGDDGEDKSANDEGFADFDFEEFERSFMKDEVTETEYEPQPSVEAEERTRKFYLFYCCLLLTLLLLGYSSVPQSHHYGGDYDYQRGLADRWGREMLDRLRECVLNGDIEADQVEAIAANIGALKVYNRHLNKMYTIEIFEKMLKLWYKNLHYRLEPAESKRNLISVLKQSGCNSDIVRDISSQGEMKWYERVWSSARRSVLATVTDQRTTSQVGLETLLGGDALQSLRGHVHSGAIGDRSLEEMARQMGVLTVFSHHHRKLHNGKLLEKMLEEWFRQTLHRLQPSEARKSLVFVLKVSDCPDTVMEEIESVLFDQNFWKLWKYLKMHIFLGF